ncbi:hypothetical protein V5799_003778 [Amblyomma americanum]|uniref:Uncharacterized protein n=1 Tax=Amblyomma americanum TaxID=6943 RepID=A0AAQ4D7Z9_AMBAM
MLFETRTYSSTTKSEVAYRELEKALSFPAPRLGGGSGSNTGITDTPHAARVPTCDAPRSLGESWETPNVRVSFQHHFRDTLGR